MRATKPLAALLGAFALFSAAPPPQVDDAALMAARPADDIAAYGLFLDAAMTEPAPRVVKYGLNSTLFSDYADKARYIYVPEGETLAYDGEGLLKFPVGAAIVKHFGFVRDDGHFDKIETRLLVHQADGWKAYPYVWDESDSHATLKKAGAKLEVMGHDAEAKPLPLHWAVPNVNQCKGCHNVGDEIEPIGPKARNLDGTFEGKNNLARLQDLGLLTGVPAHPPVMPDWQDASVPVDQRARAYLDVNCGHCHNPAGPASNSGLFLTWETPRGPHMGIGKTPAAAGRGSGGRSVGIAPGKPEESILLYRMESTEPGVMMPELGRTQEHDEAVALIREWIAEMKG